MDEPAIRRRNLDVMPTIDNLIPTGKHLYWDHELRRLVASEYQLPPDGKGSAPPPNELDALLDALWASAVMRPVHGLVVGFRRFWGCRD